MELKKRLKGAWIALPTLILDRVTKIAAVEMLSGRGTVEALRGFAGFRYVENTGAAFSFFSENTWILTVVTAILVAAVTVYLLCEKNMPRAVRMGLWLVTAGGLGNLYDRISAGYVVDFIEFLFVRFAVFNVADICITCGVVLAAAGYIFYDARGKREGGHGIG